jgi:hypothetical protein
MIVKQGDERIGFMLNGWIPDWNTAAIDPEKNQSFISINSALP